MNLGEQGEVPGPLDARKRRALPLTVCPLSLVESQLVWADSLHFNSEWSGGAAGASVVHLFHLDGPLVLSRVLSSAPGPALCFAWLLLPEPRSSSFCLAS